MKYVADFETTTDPGDCRVWAYALAPVENPDAVETGIALDHFMARCARRGENMVVYFHNLKFDGTFILDFLFRCGFSWVSNRKELQTRTFTTLITDDLKFYEISACFYRKGHNIRKATFRDSLKLLPFSVDDIAKAFRLPFSKLEIDYNAPRPRGHELTEQELEYVRNDVRIVAAALKSLFDHGLTKMTVGANALSHFKKTVPFFTFSRYFPIPVYDAEIRQSYRGGYTYIRKDLRNKELGRGIVLDVNSLYPWVMKTKPLPYGEGIYFDGKYKKNGLFDQYVQLMTCQFKLKPGHLPTILDHYSTVLNAEYLESSGREVYSLYLTHLDLDLLFRHYDVYNEEYVGGWMFRSRTGTFDVYIDYWIQKKTEAKQAENWPMYTIAKLMLNSLYGKLGVNPNVRNKIPIFADNRVDFVPGELEHREPLYIPAASYITAWARHTTITAAQGLYGRFIYADTDSLHLMGTDLPESLQVDPIALGAWKHEETFAGAKYIRAKCYIHRDDTAAVSVTAAGLPHRCHDAVTWDNFRPGAVYSGKLVPKTVPGGVVLEPVDFSIDLA